MDESSMVRVGSGRDCLRKARPLAEECPPASSADWPIDDVDGALAGVAARQQPQGRFGEVDGVED
jgi:hypothetical protein